MKKVLITGGNGYFGTSIVNELLKQKYKVYVIDGFYSRTNNLNKLKNKNLTIFKLNLLKYKNINYYFEKYRFDTIVHCASLVGEEACIINRKFAKKINLDLTKKIFQFALNYDVGHFIFTSTCSNYGVVKNKLINENQKLFATGLYSKYKILSEKFLKRRKQPSIKITIFRFGTLFGSAARTRFDLLINDMVLNFYNDNIINIYSPNSWRPYVHIQDAARAISEVIRNQKKKFDIYNVCSMNIIKINLVKSIFKLIKKGNYKIVPNKFGQRDYKVDSSKFINLYKFKFKFNLNNSIKEIIKFIKKEKVNLVNSKKIKYTSIYKINSN